MKTVGILGAGSFGIFLAKKLDPYVTVRVSSTSGKGGKWAATQAEVGQCDYLILSIPLDAYESVLETLPIAPDTVIVDVCSVKQTPVEIIKSIKPHHKIVATHPLFGPESAQDSLEGHTIVLCPDASDEIELQNIAAFSKHNGLDVVEMSAENHDEEMAVVQGLTFFVSKALHEIGIHHQTLETPSFKRLRHLAELDTHHSDELFYTIQAGNPQAKAVRKRFIEAIQDVDRRIQQ